jgi:hypothetical protein
MRSRVSSVDISPSLAAEQPGFDSRQGKEIFIFSIEHRPALGLTQPPIQWAPEILSLGLKQQGREADSRLSNAFMEKCLST